MRKTLFYITTIFLCTGSASCQDHEPCDNDLIGQHGDAYGGAFPIPGGGGGSRLVVPTLPLNQGYTITTDTYRVPNLFPDSNGNRIYNNSTITRVYPADQQPPASDILRFFGVPPRR